MFKRHIRIALRTIQKHKFYSFLNIFGLAMSIACAIFILQWILHELSYDNFHANTDRIYRVVSILDQDAAKWASTPGPLAPALRQELPEIESVTRFRQSNDFSFRYDKTIWIEEGHAIADPSFFELFAVTFLEGQADHALAAPYNIVITEDFARKYFSNTSPLNQKIETEDGLFTVSAVVENIPSNSQFQFNYLTTFAAAENQNPMLKNWFRYPTYTYVRLTQNADPAQVSDAIRRLMLTHQTDHTERSYELQALKDIHFTTNLFNDDSVTINRNYIYIFVAVAIFIVLIACINYMSLSTARFSNRAKEIGLKRVVGASRRNLISQFFGEAYLMTLLAFVISLILVEIFRPAFCMISGIDINYFSHPIFIFSLASLLLLTGFLSGFYPAMYLSQIQPTNIFQKSMKGWSERFSFRHVLTIIQLSLAIALIVGMLIVNRQVHFLQMKQLGFNKNNIVCLQVDRGTTLNYQTMKHELEVEPAIQSVAIKNCSPTVIYRATQAQWQGKEPDKHTVWEVAWIDDAYIPELEIPLIQGRDFSEGFETDETEAAIINEAGAREMDLELPIGEHIELYGQTRTIVGVIQDANFHSLHKQIEPQIYLPVNEEQIHAMGCTFLIRPSDDIKATIRIIERVWQKWIPNRPFDYKFLDEQYTQFYNLEQRIQLLLNVFTFFSIFISCLGLLGLSMFMVEKRTKEMGIRKVLGASDYNVLVLLSMQFIKLIVLANILAWPIAWYAMNKWLQNFAYRIDLTIWSFLLAGLSALLVVLLTISWQAIKAAMTNPVESLRYE